MNHDKIKEKRRAGFGDADDAPASGGCMNYHCEPLKEVKILLTSFWDSMGGRKNNGEKESYNKKLLLLQDFSKKEIIRKNDYSKKNRIKFENVKLHRHSLKSHKKCFVCQNTAELRHHIILIKNGGTNCKKNLLSLCNKCHNKIHPWLKKGLYENT